MNVTWHICSWESAKAVLVTYRQCMVARTCECFEPGRTTHVVGGMGQHNVVTFNIRLKIQQCSLATVRENDGHHHISINKCVQWFWHPEFFLESLYLWRLHFAETWRTMMNIEIYNNSSDIIVYRIYSTYVCVSCHLHASCPLVDC